MTKEPKLERAQRLLPEWKVYDNQVKEFQDKVVKKLETSNSKTRQVLLESLDSWFDHSEL